MLALVAMLCSCSGNKFKVAGNVSGASDSTVLFLEFSSNGAWIPIDSTTTSSSGDYSFAEDAPQYPNIYRIRYNNQAVYFPIDSIESLTMNTTLKKFDTDFTLDGSDNAKQVMKIDKDAIKYAKASAEQIDTWKKSLAKQILSDPSGMVAYYVINKYVNGQPLFDPTNDFDMKIIGAVANAFNSYKKDDPRTQYLVKMTLEGQQRRRLETGAASSNAGKVEAQLVNVIDIKLQDMNGVERSLSQETSKGKVVLLSFTMYDQQFSPQLNKLLNDIYTQYKDNVIIYQVGFDENVAQWRQSAQNIPWIAVYDPSGSQSTVAAQYNLYTLPTTFIINKSGEIVERNENPNTLKASLAKYM